MPGVIVDGNDVLAVRDAALAAVRRARAGEGPTLLECKTYRFCGHSRSDACNYRTRDEEAAWKQRDPLLVLGAVLAAAEDPRFEEMERSVSEEIDAAVAYAEAGPDPLPEDALLHVYWEGE